MPWNYEGTLVASCLANHPQFYPKLIFILGWGLACLVSYWVDYYQIPEWGFQQEIMNSQRALPRARLTHPKPSLLPTQPSPDNCTIKQGGGSHPSNMWKNTIFAGDNQITPEKAKWLISQQQGYSEILQAQWQVGRAVSWSEAVLSDC